jgi:hypothetical protein
MELLRFNDSHDYLVSCFAVPILVDSSTHTNASHLFLHRSQTPHGAPRCLHPLRILVDYPPLALTTIHVSVSFARHSRTLMRYSSSHLPPHLMSPRCPQPPQLPRARACCSSVQPCISISATLSVVSPKVHACTHTASLESMVRKSRQPGHRFVLFYRYHLSHYTT